MYLKLAPVEVKKKAFPPLLFKKPITAGIKLMKKHLAVSLIALFCSFQQSVAQSNPVLFQVEFNDSLKKVIQLYIEKQESQRGLSNKKNVININYETDAGKWYISAQTSYRKSRMAIPMYLSKINDYWITFNVDGIDTSTFKYPPEYKQFYEKEFSSILKELPDPKMETITVTQNGKSWKVTRPVADLAQTGSHTTGSENKFQIWVATFSEDGPPNIKINL